MTGAKPAAAGEPPLLMIEAAIATIRLARPRLHNRLEPQDLHQLADYFEQINADHSIRAVILTASGNSFSSGYHLGALQQDAQNAPEQPAASVPDSEPTLFARVVDQLETLRPPTICALNGSVYGGATDLALACDFRLGVTRMQLLMPAARLGIHYYASGLRRYVSRLGLANAQRLFLTAQAVNADELIAMGYLTELVDAADLPARSRQLAEQLARNAPAAVQGMKQHLNAIASGVFDPATINYAHKASLHSAEAREGVQAWHEKRAPHFDD